MDNREELLDALNDFSRKQSKEIPPLLEQFLKQVAKTGETLFSWTLLKALFVAKLEQVMGDFNEESISDQIPSYPNVENARFDVYRARIMEAVHRFHGTPFTIQRLCELLTDPKRHYKRCDKFMRGLEKNVLVVSTVDPFGRKVVSESKNLVNGMDGNSSNEDPSPSTSFSLATPSVPTWASPSTSGVWPLSADIVTPSTSPLLEVCDLPDPKDTSFSSPSVDSSSLSPSVNGHDMVSSADSVEIATDSSVSAVTHSSAESSESTTLSVVTTVTSMEEAVDSSDQAHQQVAAEEMVGVEEEAATSTAISQEAAGMVEETVVETSPVPAEVTKGTTETAKGTNEATPAASGDWLAKVSEKEADMAPMASEPQDDKCKGDGAPMAEIPSSTGSHSPTGSLADTFVKEDGDSKTAETMSGKGDGEGSMEGGKMGDGEQQVGSDIAPNTDVGVEGKTDPEAVNPISEVSDSSQESSSKDHIKEKQSLESTQPAPDAAVTPEVVPSASRVCTSSDISQSSSPSQSSDIGVPCAAPSSDITTPTSAASQVSSSTADQVEENTATDTGPTSSMDAESADSSSSVPQAAESSTSECAPGNSSDNAEVQKESSSTDNTLQAEPMEQD